MGEIKELQEAKLVEELKKMEETQKSREKDSVKDVENLEEIQENPDEDSGKGVKKDDDFHDQSLSPKGVLEIPISGSDYDHSSNISISESSCGSSFNEKSDEIEEGDDGGGEEEEEDAGDGNGAGDGTGDGGGVDVSFTPGLQWKNLFQNNIKWKSLRRFSTIPMLGFNGYEFSAKNLRRKMMRNRISEDANDDDGGSVVPKLSCNLQELYAEMTFLPSFKRHMNRIWWDFVSFLTG